MIIEKTQAMAQIKDDGREINGKNPLYCTRFQKFVFCVISQKTNKESQFYTVQLCDCEQLKIKNQ